MVRKGASFTIYLVVVALVLMVTAFLVISIQQDYLFETGEKVGEGTERGYNQTQLELLQFRCEMKMDQYCDAGSTGTTWADRAEVDGNPCSDYWPEGGIPSCD